MQLFLPLAVLILASLLTLSSISAHLFALQLLWVVMGIGLISFFYFFDWRIILSYRWLIGGLYLASVLLLATAYLTSPIVRNVRSWIFLGPFSLEPVELTKVALIFVYASYFSRRHLSVALSKNILTSFVFFLVPAILTAIQPDMGSALVLFGIWFGFIILSGLPLKRLLIAVLIFALAGFFIWSHVLKNYHRERVYAVFYPQYNELGINYSVVQSKIAIGSSGFWGKGYSQGSELQLGFLTEPASDFVLAAFIEEWGIFGGIVVILSFLALIFSILRIGTEKSGNFEKFICLGTATVLGLQFILNTGSELGLTPVIGVTFPFLSYGGSSLLSNFLLLSVVNAIAREN